MINITIDGQKLQVPEGTTILKAAQMAHIKIPTLCYSEELSIYGGCRLCVVEVENERLLQPSCAVEVREGMVVRTHTPKVKEARKTIFELMIASHDLDCRLNCLTCSRGDNCELRSLANELGVREIRLKALDKGLEEDRSSYSIVREPNKCISCGRCVRKCEEVQGIGIFTKANRGPDTIITTFKNKGMGNLECVNCGQCILACPTGALHEVYHYESVWDAIHDPTKHVVVQTAPAVRVALAESFGLPPGTVITGQMVNALKRLGFDKVFDTNFSADLTIMEEGTELINRIKSGGKLPLLTSCSPGWIKFIEHFYPELLDNVSTCKSPQQMLGAMVKSYYAEKNNIPKEDIVVVSIMPCTAKKYEARRPEMDDDVDYVLTTRELVLMIKEMGIDIVNLEEEEYDKLMGSSSGAAVIFGATGGVMEAALRTAYEILTGEELPGLDFLPVRGIEGIKEAEVQIGEMNLNVAVAHGLANVRRLMDMIRNGKKYHFIELMACPGGCIGGGGQPIPTNMDVIKKRMEAIYKTDLAHEYRKSHENPEVKQLYAEYLGEPGSHLAHKLLHTHYTPRGV
ncbi:MAG: [FeFe] hydrogenase, group A [Halanaerobiales bacterium]|nr:[FeFe] hydrogenase, group A [Halanaerobiales bacterium]